MGTSLSELRQLDFIDEDSKKGLRLICSSDSEASAIEELQPSDLLPANTLRCGIYQKAVGNQWEQAKISVLGEKASPILLVSVGTGLHPAHLSEIVARLNNSRFQEVLTLLKRTYGTPANYEMSNVDTLYGGVSNATYTWNNGLGSIKVDMLTVALDKMSIQLSEQPIPTAP